MKPQPRIATLSMCVRYRCARRPGLEPYQQVAQERHVWMWGVVAEAVSEVGEHAKDVGIVSRVRGCLRQFPRLKLGPTSRVSGTCTTCQQDTRIATTPTATTT